MDQFSSVQLLIPVQLFATAWTAACQASLSVINSRSWFKLISIESAMPSSHFILCHPLLLLPSSFPSIRVFSNELIVPIRWPKYGNFIFSINPSNEYSRLISFTIDWLDLLAVQGTLKSLLQTSPQCKSITSLVLSFLYSSTFTSIHGYWKTVTLTKRTFVGKVMSLLFNTLSRLVITFLPRSKHLFISWLQSPSAVILEIYLNVIKAIWQVQLTSYSMVKSYKPFPLRSGTKQRCLLLPTFTQHSTGSACQTTRQEQETKGIQLGRKK